MLAVVLGDRRVVVVAEEVHRHREEHAAASHQWLGRWQSVVDDGRKNLAWMLEQIDRGEHPPVAAARPVTTRTGEAFADFEHALREAQYEVLDALAQTAARHRETAGSQQVEMFVYIARRLHSLVTRAMSALDALEKDVEDPDLLHGLFGIDHLVTQIRRLVESLAVLGGKVPRRIRNPVLLPTVLRQAVAEIEHYTRVRVFPPRQEAALPGYAAPDAIHLLAELVENAAKFSPPETQVLLRAEPVPAGLVVEIEDRGLRMSPGVRAQMNRLLAAPDEVDLRGQLRDGRIGLLVTARIAQRHGIKVELRESLLGGTQALIVLPRPLLVAAEPTQPDVASPSASAGPGHTPAAAADQDPPPAGGLPRRTRVTPASTDQPAAGPEVADDRPALPRRSDAPPQDQPAPALPGGEVPAQPANPGNPRLMATYVAGVRRGTQNPPRPAPGSADPTG